MENQVPLFMTPGEKWPGYAPRHFSYSEL
jgi:hypothetical protein